MATQPYWMSFVASAVPLAICCLSGCHSAGPREPAIKEVRESDGVLVRTELNVDEEVMASPEVIASRMARHRDDVRSLRFRPFAGADLPGVAPTLARTNYDPFDERGCPPEGAATNERQSRLNELKNRITKPRDEDFDPGVTLAALSRRGDDTDRWSVDRAAVIEGYILKVSASGRESCNCGETSRRFTDTHIDVYPTSRASGHPIVVEITPPWRLIHEHYGKEDWSSKAVEERYLGKKVRITGWLFFDVAHLHEADNTDPNDDTGKENWRKTAWEIHPVTSIEIID